ncbi:hypothetical protein [Ottowia thiooxydans]|uniref:hypothetical protein n=1 Tax=Ottowia thiooxydans TaxID=219182 RepID=UPI000403B860|nr:hypothetical protein [Ottowia thiooxydans]
MLNKIIWREDAVISVKLRDGLHMLAQMRRNHLMQFFNIRSSDGVWANVDLSNIEPIFCIFVAEHKFKSLFERWVAAEDAKPSACEIPRRMLSAEILLPGDDGRVPFNVQLIELGDDLEAWSAQVVRSGITKDDLDVIYRHELDGMYGDAEKLKKRLIRFFDTGVNWNDELSFIFPGIPLPPPQK